MWQNEFCLYLVHKMNNHCTTHPLQCDIDSKYKSDDWKSKGKKQFYLRTFQKEI